MMEGASEDRVRPIGLRVVSRKFAALTSKSREGLSESKRPKLMR